MTAARREFSVLSDDNSSLPEDLRHPYRELASPAYRRASDEEKRQIEKRIDRRETAIQIHHCSHRYDDLGSIGRLVDALYGPSRHGPSASRSLIGQFSQYNIDDSQQTRARYIHRHTNITIEIILDTIYPDTRKTSNQGLYTQPRSALPKHMNEASPFDLDPDNLPPHLENPYYDFDDKYYKHKTEAGKHRFNKDVEIRQTAQYLILNDNISVTPGNIHCYAEPSLFGITSRFAQRLVKDVLNELEDECTQQIIKVIYPEHKLPQTTHNCSRRPPPPGQEAPDSDADPSEFGVKHSPQRERVRVSRAGGGGTTKSYIDAADLPRYGTKSELQHRMGTNASAPTYSSSSCQATTHDFGITDEDIRNHIIDARREAEGTCVRQIVQTLYPDLPIKKFHHNCDGPRIPKAGCEPPNSDSDPIEFGIRDKYQQRRVQALRRNGFATTTKEVIDYLGLTRYGTETEIAHYRDEMAGQKKKATALETPKGAKAKVQQQQPTPESSQRQQKRRQVRNKAPPPPPPPESDSEEDENEHEEDDPFVDDDQEMADINDEGTGETANDEDTQSGDEDDHSDGGISLQQDEDNALDFKPVFDKLHKEGGIDATEAKKLAAIIVAESKLSMDKIQSANPKLLATLARQKMRTNELGTTIHRTNEQRDILSKKESRRRHNKQKENQPPATFKAGNALRFSELKIRLSPRHGWNIEGNAPDAPPQLVEPTPRKTMIGMTTDGTPPRCVTDRKTGDVSEIHNDNEPVFIRLRANYPGWEFCNSLGCHLQEQFIRFDDDFSSLEDLTREAKAMQLAQKQDLARVYDEHYKAMNKWRNSVRTWEIEVLRNEWQKNNKDIFPPGTTQDDVNKAIDQLQHDIKDERLKKPRTVWIGRPETTIISAERKLLGE